MFGIVEVKERHNIQYYFADVMIVSNRFLLINSLDQDLKPFKEQINLLKIMDSIRVSFVDQIKTLAFTLQEIQYLFTDSGEALATYIEKEIKRIKREALS
ncbi:MULTISPECIES: hypothetical protein [unclassified Sporolactobacillus]|uniref:hypothetical protein n=1 Tax=unclassified Sporolactobacillus TaxID=2628533 RepID=UPI002368CD07|nr:hypothetical protein [Sporolactobacillus sp. CQH2019]MDD9149775.1 hypothetical protein [Sporolactobacillus sp. CQH2019]